MAEYQWVSALDPNIVVGMTVYESVDAFAAIAQDQEFVGRTDAVHQRLSAFDQLYPPGRAGAPVSGEMSDGPIYEVAINQVKSGRLADFTEARAAFVNQMKQANGVGPAAVMRSLSFFRSSLKR